MTQTISPEILYYLGVMDEINVEKITQEGQIYRADFKDGSVCSFNASIPPGGILDQSYRKNRNRLQLMTDAEACEIAHIFQKSVSKIERNGPSFTFYMKNGDKLRENMILAMT